MIYLLAGSGRGGDLILVALDDAVLRDELDTTTPLVIVGLGLVLLFTEIFVFFLNISEQREKKNIFNFKFIFFVWKSN